MKKKLETAQVSYTTSTRRLKAILCGSIANLIEWFDWYIYAAFAIYFSAAFFPDNDQTGQLLKVAGIFAVGFLMRPIGAWLFGVLAGRIGRKKSMLLAVWLMSLGSLMIAITPTYDTIGVFAPIVLVIARLMQGLSVGGEVGVSTTYLAEMATPDRRGFYSSFQYATLIGGLLMALGILIILQKFFLTEAQLMEWGWRIPFAIGAVLTLVTIYLKKDLHETRAYTAVQQKGPSRESMLVQLFRHPKAILKVIGLTSGSTLAFYTFTTYMQKYLVNTLGTSKADATMISFLSLLVFAIAHPILGGLSDRIGRRPLLLAFGILGTFGTIPLMNAVASASSNWELFFLLTLGLLIVAIYTSIAAVVKAELFPAEVRAIGVGLPHALTVATFGGTAEYVALWFKSIGHETWYYYYVTGAIFISLILFVFMEETLKTNKIDGEPHG